MATNEKHDNAKARRQEKREQLKAQHRRESEETSQSSMLGTQPSSSNTGPIGQGSKSNK